MAYLMKRKTEEGREYAYFSDEAHPLSVGQSVRLSLIKIENLKGTKRRCLGRYYAYFSSEAHPLYFCQSVRLSICPPVSN